MTEYESFSTYDESKISQRFNLSGIDTKLIPMVLSDEIKELGSNQPEEVQLLHALSQAYGELQRLTSASISTEKIGLSANEFVNHSTVAIITIGVLSTINQYTSSSPEFAHAFSQLCNTFALPALGILLANKKGNLKSNPLDDRVTEHVRRSHQFYYSRPGSPIFDIIQKYRQNIEHELRYNDKGEFESISLDIDSIIQLFARTRAELVELIKRKYGEDLTDDQISEIVKFYQNEYPQILIDTRQQRTEEARERLGEQADQNPDSQKYQSHQSLHRNKRQG